MAWRWRSRVTVDADNPSAAGVCDRCGSWLQLRTLLPDIQWHGPQLKSRGFLVCPQCVDIPAEQLRTIILPPDPPPIYNTRPENFSLDERGSREQLDFSQSNNSGYLPSLGGFL